MTKLMKPRININGESKESLLNSHREAYLAVQNAMEVCRKVIPHGRDYQTYDDSEPYWDSLSVYSQMMADLQSASEVLEATALHIQDQ